MRPQWQFAGINFNILCLTIVADNVSLPILWTMLDKRGNSNQEERKLLILRYIYTYLVYNQLTVLLLIENSLDKNGLGS